MSDRFIYQLLLVLATTACATHEPPYVQVTGETAVGLDGVNAWGALGFVSGVEDSGLPECDRAWYSDTFEPECQLTVHISLVPGLSDDDVNGAEINGRADQDARTVEINARYTGDALHHVAAHEVGHILLDSMHLDSYIKPTWENIGIMSSMPSSPWVIEPTDNDYALACHTIGICH